MTPSTPNSNGQSILGQLVPSLAIGLTVLAAASILHDGLSARAQPSALESTIAAAMRRMAMPRAMRAMKNPVTNSPEVLREGMLHFADHCAICHGNDGSGDTMMGQGMYPRPPDLRAAATQGRTPPSGSSPSTPQPSRNAPGWASTSCRCSHS